MKNAQRDFAVVIFAWMRKWDFQMYLKSKLKHVPNSHTKWTAVFISKIFFLSKTEEQNIIMKNGFFHKKWAEGPLFVKKTENLQISLWYFAHPLSLQDFYHIPTDLFKTYWIKSIVIFAQDKIIKSTLISDKLHEIWLKLHHSKINWLLKRTFSLYLWHYSCYEY